MTTSLWQPVDWDLKRSLDSIVEPIIITFKSHVKEKKKRVKADLVNVEVLGGDSGDPAAQLILDRYEMRKRVVKREYSPAQLPHINLSLINSPAQRVPVVQHLSETVPVVTRYTVRGDLRQ